MSYSNRVCLAIKNEVTIPVTVKKLFTKEFIKKSKDDVDYYYCSDINYNRQYSQCLLDFLSELKEIDEELFGYVRLGEECNDIQTLGNFDDFDIYPYTKISTPFDNDEDNFEV